MTHARDGRPASGPPLVDVLHRVARWVFALPADDLSALAGTTALRSMRDDAQPKGGADMDDDPLLGAFNIADDFEVTPVIWERPIERQPD